MLVLTRRRGESVKIGDDVVVTILKVHGGAIRVGIEAPEDVAIIRTELEEEKENGSTRILPA